MQKNTRRFRRGSNPRPLACEASVITTTLRNHTILATRRSSQVHTRLLVSYRDLDAPLQKVLLNIAGRSLFQKFLFDRDEIRTRNLLIRSQTPYPLGHAAARSPSMVAHMNQPLFSHSNWLVVCLCNCQKHTKQLKRQVTLNRGQEEQVLGRDMQNGKGCGGGGGGVGYRMTLYNVRIYETSYCLHHASILLSCMDGWTKVISGEPGHRSPYLSHAKRALYHLS